MSWGGQIQRVGLKRTQRRKSANGDVPASRLFRELAAGAEYFWAKRGGKPEPVYGKEVKR